MYAEVLINALEINWKNFCPTCSFSLKLQKEDKSKIKAQCSQLARAISWETETV